MNIEERNVYHQEMLEQYYASGQSAKEWCETSGVKLQSLYYWIRKNKQATAIADSSTHDVSVQFVSLDTVASNKNLSNDYSCQVPVVISSNNYKIELFQGFSKQVLKETLEVLDLL